MQKNNTEVSMEANTSLETHMSSQMSLDDSESSSDEVKSQSVLPVLAKHLNAFEERLIDSEIQVEQTKNIGRRIEEILFEQLDDGLLSYIAFTNLYHIKHLWVSTSIALTTYSCNDRVSKKEIVDKLIELYTLKELKREKLVDILLKL